MGSNVYIKLCIGFFILHSVITYNNDNELSFNLIREGLHLIMNIGVGNPIQYFNVVLDINSHHLWFGNVTLDKVLPKVFYGDKSLTYEETTTDTTTNNQVGIEVMDIISNNEKNLSQEKKFHFVLLNKLEANLRKEGLLGLAREYPGVLKFGKGRSINAHPKYSLLSYLSLAKIINNKSFSIQFTSNNDATLTLGDSSYDDKVYKSCSPNEQIKHSYNYYKWHCTYNEITFINGTNVFTVPDLNYHVIFETMFDHIELPDNQGNALFIGIQKQINVQCKKVLISDSDIAMFCPKGIDIKTIPSFIIKIDGFDFTILGKELFDDYYLSTGRGRGEYGYLSKVHINKQLKNTMRIGYAFMKYYKMIFDMTTGTVNIGEFNDIFEHNFISNNNNNIPNHNNINNATNKELMLFKYLFLIALICCVLLLGYILCKKRLLKHKVTSLRTINKNTSKSSDVIINPIGKPMLDK